MRETAPPQSTGDRVRGSAAGATPAQRVLSLLDEAYAGLQQDAHRARALAEEAAALARDIGDDAAHAEATFVLGECAALLLDHERALAAYGSALEAFEARGDEPAVARTLRAKSFIHDALGDVPRALEMQFRALEIDQRLGDTGSEAATLRTIGVVYSRSGETATGLDFYRRSLALCAPDDAVGRAKTLNNIGINQKNLGELGQAREALEGAHAVFRELAMPLQQCATLNNLGVLHHDMGNLARAESTLHDALALSAATGYRYGVAHASLWLGKLCAGQSRHDEAFTWLQDAIAVCIAHDLKPTQYEAHEALAALCEATADHAGALAHYRRFHALEREVRSEAARDKLRAMHIRFDVASARRETQLLREAQAALQKANEELDALNVSLTEANLQKTMLLDKLERQTHEDALTGLANRRRLEQRLADEFALAQRHDRSLCVAMADLDHFKTVNDRYSHAVGDAALRATAALLAGNVRHTDLVARFGGEEFVIVFAETDVAAAHGVCEKLRAAVEEYDWSTLHPGLALTISVGLSADTGVPAYDRMLAHADRNLYRAKAAGRNRVVSGVPVLATHAHATGKDAATG